MKFIERDTQRMLQTFAKILGLEPPPADPYVMTLLPLKLKGEQLVAVFGRIYSQFSSGQGRRFPFPNEVFEIAANYLSEQAPPEPLFHEPDLPEPVRVASGQMAEILSKVLGRPRSEWKKELTEAMERVYRNIPDHPYMCARCHDTGLLTIYGFLEDRARRVAVQRDKKEETFYQAALSPNSPTWEYPGDYAGEKPDPSTVRMVARCSCGKAAEYSGVGASYLSGKEVTTRSI